MQIEKANENKLIDLKTLGEILLIKKVEGVKKWCQSKGINIETVGNKRVVHLFMINLELDKGLILKLQNDYPNKWKKLYKCYKENDHIGYLSLINDNSDKENLVSDELKLDIETLSNNLVSDRVVPVSARAKKLLNS
jgi:hypothetical protein